ncbi:LppU/SCO3897 family protein [Mangrovihabitans endophyticus]|uniref:Uncharacterized protein n=1 Tax=Mangrovihabitans endophyticus TaxID=1751298 RepID=A0A8J3FPG3_9ACTN|nr:hypothetical protein [Mangrovihabitans endophyticus]GGK95069.1 hypothetical protein GCM10012284_31400 [Mangrovihabitans endophyticus]
MTSEGQYGGQPPSGAASEGFGADGFPPDADDRGRAPRPPMPEPTSYEPPPHATPNGGSPFVVPAVPKFGQAEPNRQVSDQSRYGIPTAESGPVFGPAASRFGPSSGPEPGLADQDSARPESPAGGGAVEGSPAPARGSATGHASVSAAARVPQPGGAPDRSPWAPPSGEEPHPYRSDDDVHGFAAGSPGRADLPSAHSGPSAHDDPAGFGNPAGFAERDRPTSLSDTPNARPAGISAFGDQRVRVPGATLSDLPDAPRSPATRQAPDPDSSALPRREPSLGAPPPPAMPPPPLPGGPAASDSGPGKPMSSDLPVRDPSSRPEPAPWESPFGPPPQLGGQAERPQAGGPMEQPGGPAERPRSFDPTGPFGSAPADRGGPYESQPYESQPYESQRSPFEQQQPGFAQQPAPGQRPTSGPGPFGMALSADPGRGDTDRGDMPDPPAPFGGPADRSPFGEPAARSPFGEPAARSPFGEPAARSPFGEPDSGPRPFDAPPSSADRPEQPGFAERAPAPGFAPVGDPEPGPAEHDAAVPQPREAAEGHPTSGGRAVSASASVPTASRATPAPQEELPSRAAGQPQARVYGRAASTADPSTAHDDRGEEEVRLDDYPHDDYRDDLHRGDPHRDDDPYRDARRLDDPYRDDRDMPAPADPPNAWEGGTPESGPSDPYSGRAAASARVAPPPFVPSSPPADSAPPPSGPPYTEFTTDVSGRGHGGSGDRPGSSGPAVYGSGAGGPGPNDPGTGGHGQVGPSAQGRPDPFGANPYGEHTTDISGRPPSGPGDPYVPPPALSSMHAPPPVENGFPPSARRQPGMDNGFVPQQPGFVPQQPGEEPSPNGFGGPANRATVAPPPVADETASWPGSSGEAEQGRFDQFKPDAAEETAAAKPETPHVRMLPTLISVIVGAALLVGVAIGIVWLISRGSDSGFDVNAGDCVAKSGSEAVKADCGAPGAFQVVSIVDNQAQCDDPGQPYVVNPTSDGRTKVLCLKPGG